MIFRSDIRDSSDSCDIQVRYKPSGTNLLACGEEGCGGQGVRGRPNKTWEQSVKCDIM